MEERVAALQRIAEQLEPRLRAAFLAAVERWSSRIDRDALERAIDAQSMAAAVVALQTQLFSQELQNHLEPVLREIFKATAIAEATRLAAQLKSTLSYDVANPETLIWIRNHTAEYVRLIADNTEQGIRAAIRLAIERVHVSGLSSQAAVQEIYQVIGLTNTQAEVVAAKRDELIAKGVTGQRLEQRMETFTKAQRLMRAHTIARHESMAAANGGQIALWKQARDKGLLKGAFDQHFLTGKGVYVEAPPAHILCRCGLVLDFLDDGTAWMRWIVVEDERLCDECAPIPDLPQNQPPRPLAAA